MSQSSTPWVLPGSGVGRQREEARILARDSGGISELLPACRTPGLGSPCVSRIHASGIYQASHPHGARACRRVHPPVRPSSCLRHTTPPPRPCLRTSTPFCCPPVPAVHRGRTALWPLLPPHPSLLPPAQPVPHPTCPSCSPPFRRYRPPACRQPWHTGIRRKSWTQPAVPGVGVCELHVACVVMAVIRLQSVSRIPCHTTVFPSLSLFRF